MLATQLDSNRHHTGRLTGSSFCVVHSVRFAFMIVCSLRRVGRAIAPAVVAMYRGESAERPRSEQNSRVKEFATSVHADGLLNMALYGESSRFGQKAIAPINCWISRRYLGRNPWNSRLAYSKAACLPSAVDACGFFPPWKSQTNCSLQSSNSRLLPLASRASLFCLAQFIAGNRLRSSFNSWRIWYIVANCLRNSSDCSGSRSRSLSAFSVESPLPGPKLASQLSLTGMFPPQRIAPLGAGA